MRGKASPTRKLSRLLRITPAYAGKSSHLCKSFRGHRDHPRLCGEKSICYDSTRPCSGSPPPMRGKVREFWINLWDKGITPAYAGKSVAQAALNLIMRDHPRLCGEKPESRLRCWWLWGSPPPMRGKVSSDAPFSSRARITPAYAGKSNAIHLPNLEFQDHPRLCGEKFTDSPLALAGKGSPPPMRGKGSKTVCKD